MLIVISGLPGTGKSSVAMAVATHLGAVHLSIDEVEDGLLGAGLPRGWTTGVGAYEAVRAAAEQNLRLGHVVVVDAVNDSEPARETWRRAAESTGQLVRFILLTPPEPPEHRRRVEQRDRRLRHIPAPTWQQVEERSATFEPWRDKPIEVDSNRDLERLVEQVLDAVATKR